MGDRIPPVKYKCTSCGREQYLVLYGCECDEYCHCSHPRCPNDNCNGIMVQKRIWVKEVIGEIWFNLCQLYELGDNMEPVDNSNTRTLDGIRKKLELLGDEVEV